MWGLAAKQMDHAADKATSYKDKINFYNKEMDLLVRSGDYLMIDKAFKKAMICGASSQEKDLIKQSLKLSLMNRAAEFEKKNQRANASQIYERLLEMVYLINETERKQLIGKLGEIYSKIGRIKDAMKYEQMLTKPLAPLPKDPDVQVKKVSWEDLGIEHY
jgi:tetratricopeptide (TPR) repeat protein